MISKESQNSDICEEFKQHVIMQHGEDLIGDQNQLIYEHLNICQTCFNYYQTVLKMQESLVYDDSDLQPDPRVRLKLISRLNEKNIKGEKGHKKFLDKLSGVFGYRVPVYQAVFAFFLLCALVFTLDQVSISKRPTYRDSAPYLYMDQTILINSPSYNINLIQEHQIGRNVKEDSILARYLVSSM